MVEVHAPAEAGEATRPAQHRAGCALTAHLRHDALRPDVVGQGDEDDAGPDVGHAMLFDECAKAGSETGTAASQPRELRGEERSESDLGVEGAAASDG